MMYKVCCLCLNVLCDAQCERLNAGFYEFVSVRMY